MPATSQSPAPVVVVGAGIAGAACARALTEHGLPVRLLDRGRRPGGRMSGRELDGRHVDLGASYFTVSDDGFRRVAEDWRDRGLAHEWTDTFSAVTAEHPDAEPELKQGPMRWGASQGLVALVEDLVADLDPERHHVDAVTNEGGRLVVDGDEAAAVVLAMPDAQALRLLDGGADGLDEAAGALTHVFEPTLALAAWWPERTWDLDGVFVNGDDALTWIADDGRRRGDDAACLVAHSTPTLAAAHLEDPDAAAPRMLDCLRRLLDLDAEPAGTHAHRWTYAKPTGARSLPFLLTDAGLGVCGDGWGEQSKVEGAWLSGHRLGQALAARLG